MFSLSKSLIAGVFTLLVSTVGSVEAAYNIKMFDPPGKPFFGAVEVFGINDKGEITVRTLGQGHDSVSWVYDSKKDEYFRPLEDDLMNYSGISNNGVIAGAADDVTLCASIDKKGNISVVDVPNADVRCIFRGLNSAGMMVGIAQNGPGDYRGVLYNSKTGELTDFLPSLFTIVHGISAPGDIVGSLSYEEDVSLAFLKEKNASDEDVITFSLTNAFPGTTRARGISSDGTQIVGWALLAGTNTQSPNNPTISYLVDRDVLSTGGAITLTNDQIIGGTPCNPVQPPETTGLIRERTDYLAFGVNNNGTVVGECRDFYRVPGGGPIIGYLSYGFMAEKVD